MKIFINLFCLLFLVLNSVFSQINVIPVTDSEIQIKKNSFIYSLPRVTINISITVETEYFFPGPYQKFADKYLTIRNTVQDPYVISKISDVTLNSITEPDPAATFLLTLKNKNFVLNYYSSAIIKSFGLSDVDDKTYTFPTEMSIPKYFEDNILFTDMSVKRNFINITDTTYKVIQVDSIFQKIPVYNKVITSKEFEQKAEEAANFIIKLRKRKFKLMTGQFETEPPPTDVKMLIEELEELEKEYLSLFIGKTVKIENTFNFRFTPSGNVKEEKIVLFHLSDEYGIMDEENADTEPVYCHIINSNNTSEIERFYNRQTELKNKDKNKGLFYRIPGYATVRILHDDIKYVEQIMMIPQCGQLNYLPAKLFKNKSLKVIFDENSGSVKSISNE